MNPDAERNLAAGDHGRDGGRHLALPCARSLAGLATPSIILSALLCLLAATPASGETGLALTLNPPPAGGWLSPCAVVRDGQGWSLRQLFFSAELWDYELGAGWRPVDWGPSPGEDLVFGGLVGLPQIRLAASYAGFEILPPLEYENFYAFLPPRDGSGRLLIGRRYTTDWSEGRWMLGFTEAALLSGDYSPYYLIPYPFFPLSVGKVFLSETRTGDRHDANMLYGLDLAYRDEGLTAYASLLVDEAPLTAAWAGPWRVGAQFGAEIAGVFGREDLKMWGEYTGISRYAYAANEGYARADFLAGSRLLGHPLGPDADLFLLRMVHEAGTRRTWCGMARERRGEGGLDDRWTPVDGQTLSFLGGTVETSFWVEGGLSVRFGEDLTVAGSAGLARVTNQDNLEGVTGWAGRFSLDVTYAL
ncbi:MAG: hypothetical protein ACM3XS_06865 [Bacteroidota bacterium]